MFAAGLHLADKAASSLLPELCSENNRAFGIVAAQLAKVEAVKGKGYKASWQRDGMTSAYYNIKRKYDRVEAIMDEGDQSGGESLTENLADLSVYAMKTIILQAELKPEDTVKWLDGVRNLE